MGFVRIIILIGLVIGTSNLLVSQSIEVSGRIVGENHERLIGAAVKVEPAGLMQATDSLGSFKFMVSPSDSYTITVSHVGYEIEKITIPHDQLLLPIFIHMRAHVEQLHEARIVEDLQSRLRKQTALNTQVVGDSFIRENLGGSLMQSLERLAGVSLIGIGSGQSKPLIRGLGFNRVAVVEKGIKHEGQQWGADHGLEIDQFSASQIQIVKGPASFMYGSDAIGGVIDIKAPSIPQKNTLGGAINLVGKTNNNLLGGSFNLYGRSEKLFFNARFTHQDYGDYRVPTDTVYVYDYAVKLHNNRLRNSAGNETNLHLDLGYASDKIQSVFYISNIAMNSGFFANAHGLEPRRVDTDLHDASSRDILYPKQNVNHFKIINSSKFFINDKNLLETEIGYQHNFRQEFNQYVNHGYMPAQYPEDSPTPQDLEREFNKKVLSANIKDQLWWRNHAFTIGVNGEHQDNTINGWGFLVPAYKQQSLGAFVYDKYTLSKKVFLHGALRYDYAHINISSYQDWFPSTVETDNGSTEEYVVRAQNQSRNFNSLTWALGLNYNLKKFGFKANVGKSFRVPIAKELGANGVNYHYFSYERGNIDLDPEQSYQADLGFNYTQNKWFVELTPFVNYFSNYIYLNPTAYHDYLYGAGNQVFEYTQSEVIRYGSELQFSWEFYKNLTVNVTGEYVYSLQLSGDKEGYTLPFSPPASALTNLSWTPHLSDKLKNTSFSIDWRVAAAQNNIVPPERKTPGYQIFGLKAGTQIKIKKQPIECSLQVQNIFNKKYMMHTSFYRLIGLPEAGRNIILSINIPFLIQ